MTLPSSVYSFPTLVDFGAGAVRNLPTWVRRFGSRPLIVTDSAVPNLPLFRSVTTALEGGGVDYALFTGVSPNPTDDDVHRGAALMREKGCDLVIGLGGGSALDGAKGIALMASHEGHVIDYDDAKGGDAKITVNVPPTLCIPTTAGTGSEVGRSTVVVDTKRNVKVVVCSPHLMPKVAILDPELHVGMPAHLTAATGMDALTHNVEALLAKGFHPMADGVALAGIRLIDQALATAVEQPNDLDARGKMALAATMGATAFQKGLGVIHSLAHPCSTIAGVHHGLANGVLIEAGLRFNREAALDGLALMARVLGLPGNSDGARADAAIAWVAALRDRIGIPSRLRDVGVTRDQLAAMLAQAVDDGCKGGNPRPVSEDDLRTLYEQAF